MNTLPKVPPGLSVIKQYQDTVLHDIKEWYDKEYKYITNNFEFHEIKYIKTFLTDITALKEVLDMHLVNLNKIHNEVHVRLTDRFKIFKKQIQIVEETKESSLSTTNSKSKYIDSILYTPYIPSLIAITVPSLHHVPDTQLYYVQETDQFAFKLGGVLFRGHIGNMCASHRSIKASSCKYGKTCRNINTETGCRYYHDPLHVEISKRKNEIHNYTNSSWLYTTELLKESNKHMRHIGHRDTMHVDIVNVSKDEADIWIHQSIHNILVTMVLHQFGKI